MLPVLAAVMVTSTFAAKDPSIERLLGKLPAPEKFIDPAINDPLAKQVEAAAKAQKFGVALDASRRLAGRYPKSLGAQMIHGMLALALRRYPEASGAYRKATSLQPDFAAAYLGLAVTEAAQARFRAALPHFQKVTRLAPQAEIGWTGASACAERLGRLKESVQYARQATVVAPSSAGAWYQLAREEGLSGNHPASAKALARARQLDKTTRRSSERPRPKKKN